MKFLVSPAAADEIDNWARQRLDADPHGANYRVSSLYFDNAAFDVLRKRGSFGRAKYRVRRYDASETAYLERKLKAGDRVAKIRSETRLDDLARLDSGNPDRDWAGFWFHRRLIARRLKPVCRIGYDRTARVAATVRLTIDRAIRASANQAFDPGAGHEVMLLEQQVIVEMKYQGAFPSLFKCLMETFSLHPAPVSKYRAAAARLGFGDA